MKFITHVFLLASVLAGCSDAPQQPLEQRSGEVPGCQPHIQSCVHTEQQLVVRWSVDADELAPETPMPFFIKVTGASNLEPIDMQLTGLNMYMGRIPLPLEKLTQERYRGTLLFGACSEPAMHWRASLRLKPNSAGVSDVSGKQGHEIKTIHFDFYTQLPPR